MQGMDLGFRCEGLGRAVSRIWGLGFGAQGFGLRVQRVEVGVQERMTEPKAP